MKIAIISDIHDNIWKLNAAMQKLQGVDILICCGDLCSPFIIDQLAKDFSGPIHIVFGNNDGDLFRITQKAREYDNIKIHGEMAELDMDGRKIAVIHFDNIARAIATSGTYDVVCYGHNHNYEVVRDGKTLKINPGEIMGGLSGTSTFVIYDTKNGEATRYDV